ncbi:zf-RVT domain-containing protein, partial [Cephalotus follicularis]
RTLWQVDPQQSLSVTWKSLLKLRTLFATNLVYTIGHSSSWSLWHDPWFQSIPLRDRLGNRAIYDSGLSTDATISRVQHGSLWNWPLHVVGGAFSFRAAWRSLRSSAPVVAWSKIVWFSGAIPKHSFCLWLTFRRAHLTRDKLQSLGILQQSMCPFGCGQQETIDHLFFECGYTKTVWSKVMELNNCPPPVAWNWDNKVTWALGHAIGRRFQRWMRRDGLAAAVYHCWRERNNRIFRHEAVSTNSLLARISLDVTKKAAVYLRIQDTPSNRALAENW